MADKKKKLIKAFVIIGIILVCLFLTALILEMILVRSNTPEQDYEFYEPSPNEDYFVDPEYLAADRILYYTDDMGQRWQVTDDSSIDDIGAVFFKYYFHALEQGDHEALNRLYSDSFDDFGEFTPQRTYAREVKYLNEQMIDENTFSITYSLDYKIMKNDGSFRRDIGSDMIRTQYITIFYNTDNDVWIEEVKTEYRK